MLKEKKKMHRKECMELDCGPDRQPELTELPAGDRRVATSSRLIISTV
jgi:hypothetical protein